MQASRFSTLHEWLTWLESLHPKEIDLGLTRIERVARSMDLLRLPSKIITVAGTNGKGSFVQALSELLRDAGQSVGAFTSPHILQYNERIAINGNFASDSDICDAFHHIDIARESTSLTYFEFGTLAALYLFKKFNVDYCVLEVGLGGRLDATNVIDADICVITAIDLDHQAWLGSDRESIGREKAGILREKIPFVCVDENIPESIRAHAHSLRCETFFLGERIFIEGNRITCVNMSDPEHIIDIALDTHKLPVASLAAALQAFLLLFRTEREPSEPQSIAAAKRVLECVSLPGRFEQIEYQGHSLIFDVAHNTQASSYLADNLKAHGYRDAIAIFTCMKDKDLMEISASLRSYISTWICVELTGNSRARRSAEIAGQLTDQGFSAIDAGDPENGLALAHQLNSDVSRQIVVLGSFYLVAAIKEVLQPI